MNKKNTNRNVAVPSIRRETMLTRLRALGMLADRSVKYLAGTFALCVNSFLGRSPRRP